MSKLTDYGTMVLAELATHGRPLSTASQLADVTHLTLPTVSKLLKSLAHAGLVVSTRGVQGGYALARPASAISAAEILDALEGPLALTDCSSSNGGCELESFCRVSTAWQRVNHSIRKALEDISLADLTERREPMPNLRSDMRKAATAP